MTQSSQSQTIYGTPQLFHPFLVHAIRSAPLQRASNPVNIIKLWWFSQSSYTNSVNSLPLGKFTAHYNSLETDSNWRKTTMTRHGEFHGSPDCKSCEIKIHIWTEWTKLNRCTHMTWHHADMVRRCLENKAPKYLSVHCTRGSPPSAADISILRSTNQHQLTAPRCRRITFGRRAFSVSGTHYRVSFVICLSVLVTLDAAWRRYCSRDISALSAIEMHCIILRYINFLFFLFYSDDQ